MIPFSECWGVRTVLAVCLVLWLSLLSVQYAGSTVPVLVLLAFPSDSLETFVPMETVKNNTM